MATGPGHDMAAMDGGRMRSSWADRERAIDVLKAAFAEGRLDRDEYAERVGRVYSSRTYADLALLTADLPAGPLGTLAPQAVSLPERAPAPGVPVPAGARKGPPPAIVLVVAVLAVTAAGPEVGPFGAVLILLAVFAVIRLLRSR
jgi:Domain of unknown function (DUF1707)